MIGRGVALPIRVKLSTGGVFSGDLSGKRTADPGRTRPTYHTSIDAVSVKDVPLGGLIDTSHPLGKLSPLTLHFGDVNGDFQLKRLRAYLGTEATYHDA
jgi:hypothetical protein